MKSRKFRIRTYNDKVFWIEEKKWFFWSTWGECESFNPNGPGHVTTYTFNSVENAKTFINETLAKEAKERQIKKNTVEEFEVLHF
jgi:hypothetical protein